MASGNKKTINDLAAHIKALTEAATRLAAGGEAEYQAMRKAEAEALNVGVGDLDAAVKEARRLVVRKRARGDRGKIEALSAAGWFAVTVPPHMRVCRPVPRETGRGDDLALLSFQAFADRHRHIAVTVITPNGPVETTVGEAWLAHDDRPTYDGFHFAPPGVELRPGFYNLWRGWGAVPDRLKGRAWRRCRRLLWHIREVICGGDRAACKWFLRWLAWGIQHPNEKVPTAVAMIGPQGCGKGTLAQVALMIYGAAGLHLGRAEDLTGRFNAILADKLMLYVDEALFPGNRSVVGVLKTLVTEATMQVEPKYQEARTVPNRLRILLASNEAHTIHLDTDDRRWLVLQARDVWGTEAEGSGIGENTPAQKNRARYFTDLWREINSGGVEAFMAVLSGMRLGRGFSVARPPETLAKTEQKEMSLHGVGAWIMDSLERGDDFWGRATNKQMIYPKYEEWASGRAGEKYLASRKAFWNLARSYLPGAEMPERKNLQAKRDDGTWRNWDEITMPNIQDAKAALARALKAKPRKA